MNWNYNLYDPLCKLKVHDLAQHLTQLFLNGFSPGLLPGPLSISALPKQREDLSIWRGTVSS
jgi:hypothetical protein